MTSAQTPRNRALHHIHEALKTGVRGNLRDLLREAEREAAQMGVTSPTDLEYRNLKPGRKLTDSARAGLLMRCGTRSGKVWFFRHQHPTTGKQVEVKMGAYPSDLSLSQARDLWDEMRQVRSRGEDPKSVLTAKPAAQKQITVEELVDRFMEDYAKPTKRSWFEDERQLRKHLVSAYGAMPAVAFGHKEAVDLLHRIHGNGTPREAEKLRACISTMFNFASGRTRKVLVTKPLLPPTHDNPVSAVLLPQRTAQNYKPTSKDLTAYLNGLGAIPGGDVLRLQCLCMTRIREATRAAWSEIDLDAGRWTIPAERVKNGREHLILLSRQSVGFLRVIKADQEAKGMQTPYVFPSPSDISKPRTVHTVQRRLLEARPKLGLPKSFVSHSLRHAALTWAAEEGCPRDVRDRLTNHVSGGGVDAIYNGAALNQPAKEWFQRWADHLDMLTSGNVVSIPQHA
jgi:integrase